MTNKKKLIELGVLKEYEAEMLKQGAEMFGKSKGLAEKCLKKGYENNTSISSMIVFKDTDKGVSYWWNIMRKMEEMK